MARPVDLARAVGVSPQTVRNYERFGLLPPVQRTPSGQRRYGPQHIQAIRITRLLIVGYGWPSAQRIMSALHQGDVAAALAEVDIQHARLAQQRADVDTVLKALHEVAPTSAEEEAPLQRRAKLALTISEAACRVGVRSSAVRFWEAQALLQPARDQANGYRRYEAEHLRQLQIIALLRQGGYHFEAIRSVLEEVRTNTPDQALAAIKARRLEVIAASKRCLEATAAVWDYLQQWLGEPSGRADQC